MYSLVLHPIKTLNEDSLEIKHFDEGLVALVKEMNETMIREKGIGLAAPQIGKNIKLIVIRLDDPSKGYLSYVNPKITFESAKKVAIEEGCLSVPGVYGYVQRAAKIRITYQDVQGGKHTEKATGMRAIVLQHEIDHINGILIINQPIQLTQSASRLMQRKSQTK